MVFEYKCFPRTWPILAFHASRHRRLMWGEGWMIACEHLPLFAAAWGTRLFLSLDGFATMWAMSYRDFGIGRRCLLCWLFVRFAEPEIPVVLGIAGIDVDSLAYLPHAANHLTFIALAKAIAVAFAFHPVTLS